MATERLIVVQVDSRRRVSLAKLGSSGQRFYSATSTPDGTIILTPVVIMARSDYDELVVQSRSTDETEDET